MPSQPVSQIQDAAGVDTSHMRSTAGSAAESHQADLDSVRDGDLHASIELKVSLQHEDTESGPEQPPTPLGCLPASCDRLLCFHPDW